MKKFIWLLIILAMICAYPCFLYCKRSAEYKTNECKFNYGQSGSESYESSFDPYKMLRDWPVIDSKVIENRFILIIGNPKIKWTDKTLETQQPIPKGDIASTILYFFELDETDQVILVAYVYRNKEGYIDLFVLDKTSACYKKVTSNT